MFANIIQYIVYATIILILLSLGSALFYLVRINSSGDKKIVKALTFRITLSISLFLFLMLAFVMGWVSPHAIM